MKLTFAVIIALLSLTTQAQDAILGLDSLSPKQKTFFKNHYLKRKTSFYYDLDKLPNQTYSKQVKEIFEQSYQDIFNKIQTNELVLQSSLNTYLNDLITHIYQHNDQLPKNISMLVARSQQSNAFNKGEGTIVINVGLINALETEDQLVFVLCHELAHQKLNHVLQSVRAYVAQNNSQELKSKTKEIKKQRYARNIGASDLLKKIAYSHSAHSREHEIQADSLAYILYKNLGRDPKQVVFALENLRDSDQNRDSITLKNYQDILKNLGVTYNPKWFKTDNFQDYYYHKSSKFNIDSLRTHPHVDQRVARLVQQAPEIRLDSTFLGGTTINQAVFLDWKKNSSFQNMLNDYYLKDYGQSLYQGFLLYKTAPSQINKLWIKRNLEKLYKAKKAYQLNRYVAQANPVTFTDSYNLFSSFIFNLSLEDFQTIIKHL